MHGADEVSNILYSATGVTHPTVLAELHNHENWRRTMNEGVIAAEEALEYALSRRVNVGDIPGSH